MRSRPSRRPRRLRDPGHRCQPPAAAGARARGRRARHGAARPPPERVVQPRPRLPGRVRVAEWHALARRRQPVPGRDYAQLRSYGFGEVSAARAVSGSRACRRTSRRASRPCRDRSGRARWARCRGRAADRDVVRAQRSGAAIRMAEVRDFLPRRGGCRGCGSARAASTSTGVGHAPRWLPPRLRRPDPDRLALRGHPALGLHARAERAAPRDVRRVAPLRSARLPTPLPIAVQGEFLAISAASETEQPRRPARCSRATGAAARHRRDRAGRTLNGRAASQRLEVRARYGR